MHEQINPSLPNPGDQNSSQIVEPEKHRHARLQAGLPLEVRVISILNEPRDLDRAYYRENCPLAVREEYPLPPLGEIYQASIELCPDLWPAIGLAAKRYRYSESTIYNWIRHRGIKSALLCSKHGSRRRRHIYRPDLDNLLARLASTGPNSKRAALAAVTPWNVRLHRTGYPCARRAALRAEFEKMCFRIYQQKSS
jgi:hypothetical protein